MIRQPRVPRALVRGFTLTVYSTNLFQIVTKLKNLVHKDELIYAVFGEEYTETGRKHLQGYVYFRHPCTELKARRLFSGAHVEIAEEPIAVNYDYCSKNGLYIEFGSMSDAKHQEERELDDHYNSITYIEEPLKT